MTAMLQKYGMETGTMPDSIQIERPELLERIYREYYRAGSDFVLTNTFGSNRYKLAGRYTVEETVNAAVAAAKRAAEAEREARMAEAAAKEKAEAPVEKPEGCALIGIEDFMNVELRTAKILSCEKVPKAKKLLKLQIDLGYEQRQVVSGIAKWYQPEDLVGKKIIVVANLKPAVLCGIESNGMILASGEETVRVVFLDPETPLGERVR